MDLELLIRREKLNNEIKILEGLKEYSCELKRLRNELNSLQKKIMLQCKMDGHCFPNRWIYHEDELNIGKIKIKKFTYEKACDVCGFIQKTKKINFYKKK